MGNKETVNFVLWFTFIHWIWVASQQLRFLLNIPVLSLEIYPAWIFFGINFFLVIVFIYEYTQDKKLKKYKFVLFTQVGLWILIILSFLFLGGSLIILEFPLILVVVLFTGEALFSK